MNPRSGTTLREAYRSAWADGYNATVEVGRYDQASSQAMIGFLTSVTNGSTGLLLVAFFAGMCAVGLFQCFTNVALILARPRIDATDDEFITAAEDGPSWFRRIVTQAANSNN